MNILAGDEVIQVNDQIVVSDPSCQHPPALLHRIGEEGVGSIRMDEGQQGKEGWKVVGEHHGFLFNSVVVKYDTRLLDDCITM